MGIDEGGTIKVRKRPGARRYYTPYEVAMHNSPTDCWVSFCGFVYDLTPLLKDTTGSGIQLLLENAGTDISNWFDEHGEMKTFVSPITEITSPYLPRGTVMHMAPCAPVTNYDMSYGIPWWKDSAYRIGYLSQRTRIIRLRNMLTGQEDHMEVPSEETLGEIRERYLEINWHAGSYTWKALCHGEGRQHEFEELDMNKTLEECGVIDENPTFQDHNIAEDYYIPVLQLYWNDDLTVA